MWLCSAPLNREDLRKECETRGLGLTSPYISTFGIKMPTTLVVGTTHPVKPKNPSDTSSEPSKKRAYTWYLQNGSSWFSTRWTFLGGTCYYNRFVWDQADDADQFRSALLKRQQVMISLLGLWGTGSKWTMKLSSNRRSFGPRATVGQCGLPYEAVFFIIMLGWGWLET